MDELAFVDWLKTYLPRHGDEKTVELGVGDDMAVVKAGGESLLFGSDMLLEGVHFNLDDATPEQVGHKAIAVCLSDCAAMAAVPLAAVISFGKGESMSMTIIERLYHGLVSVAGDFGCAIVGGDSCAWSQRLVIDVAMLARTDGVKPVTRSGACVDDTLYVTGMLGGSLLGKHLDFIPRVNEARWLARHLHLNAMIDLSDGLSTDLSHICQSSECGAELQEQLLTDVVSRAATELAETSGRDVLDHVLNDGEDFELLLATPTGLQDLPVLPDGMTLHPVGRIVKGSTVRMIVSDGTSQDLPKGGYRHF